LLSTYNAYGWARCPVEWQQQIRAIATASGRKEAEIVREALA